MRRRRLLRFRVRETYHDTPELVLAELEPDCVVIELDPFELFELALELFVPLEFPLALVLDDPPLVVELWIDVVVVGLWLVSPQTDMKRPSAAAARLTRSAFRVPAREARRAPETGGGPARRGSATGAPADARVTLPRGWATQLSM